MNKIFFIFSFCFFSFSGLSAQTIRADVTVFSNSPAGISAGIQAARSGVEVLLLHRENSLNATFSADDLLMIERIRDHYSYKIRSDSSATDSLSTPVAVRLQEAAELLKSIRDTVKNLTVMLNSDLRSAERNGKGWEIKLQNGSKIKTDFVIDASADMRLTKMLKLDSAKPRLPISVGRAGGTPFLKLFRSSVAYGLNPADSAGNASSFVPAAALLLTGVDNIFVLPQGRDVELFGMRIGQAAGTAAAYCAFFKTSSDNLNIRVVQGELLAFDARIIPFADVEFSDRHAIAFQHLGLTGILKTKQSENSAEIRFDTLGHVSSAELRQPMKEYYSRSQIWFADNQKDSLSIKDVIDLMQFTAYRGEELRREIEKGWKSSYGFIGQYDPKRPISRREFAVLVDTYLQPFNVRVDFNGNLMN